MHKVRETVMGERQFDYLWNDKRLTCLSIIDKF